MVFFKYGNNLLLLLLWCFPEDVQGVLNETSDLFSKNVQQMNFDVIYYPKQLQKIYSPYDIKYFHYCKNILKYK